MIMRFQIPLDASNRPLYNRVLVAINDVTSIRLSEISNIEAKNRTARYLNSSNVIFLSMDIDGVITTVNTRLSDMLNLNSEELIGQDWIQTFIVDSDRDDLRQVINTLLTGASDAVELIENQIINGDGQVYSIQWDHNVIRGEQGDIQEIVAFGSDVSRERTLESKNLQLQAQMQQSQKLNSISTLARGVAHEINNPLTGLLNYANILEEEIEDPELREFAQGIQKEGTRVAKIVSNLLTFARLDVKNKQELKVSEIIDKAVMLINQSLLTDNIHLNILSSDDSLSIHGQEQELQHVMLNLITNSWQAIMRKTFSPDEKGQITIQTQLLADVDPQVLRVTVEDNGEGIKSEHIDNVFDPFFSGSKRVRRVGMGLAVAYGIIRDHGGKIFIESEYGKHTCVTIDFMRLQDPNINEHGDN